MKRFGLITLMLACLMVACHQDSTVEPGAGTVTTITSITAQIETETRAGVLIDNQGDLNIFWNPNDKIVLTTLQTSSIFTLKTGSGTSRGNFAGKIDVADKSVYGVYPASAVVSENGLKVTIPISQNYISSNVAEVNDRVLLFGTSSDLKTFTFVPAAAVIRFDVTIPSNVRFNAINMRAEGCGLTGEGTINLSDGSVGVTDNNFLNLTYAESVAGHNDAGWAMIAPVDFKSAPGKVLYEVITSDATYVFCYKPNEKFEAGGLYTVKLSVEDFAQVESVDQLSDGKYCVVSGTIQPDPDPIPEEDPNLNVRLVRATDSTLSIGWTITKSNIPYVSEIVPNAAADYSVDNTKIYKVALYSDAACSNLVVSVDNIVANKLYSNIKPPRFVFPGLEPATTYYAKVFNTTDGTSNAEPVQMTTRASVANRSMVVTSNAAIGDMIVFENFEGIIYAGEMSSRAAGISRTDRSKLTSFDGADVKGAITASDTGYYMVDSGTEIGLFNTLNGLLDDMKLDDWGWIGGKSGANGGSVCARPGYVKIGTTSNRSFICTPVLNAIPKDKLATLRVVFKAAPYGSVSDEMANKSEMQMSVKALTKAAMTSSKNVTYRTVADEKKFVLDGERISDWKEYTVVLTDVPSGASVAIGGGLEATTTNRMLVDDIRVYVEGYQDAPEPSAVKGTIKYSDGTAAAGISVSDGYTVVQTAADGSYTITPHCDTWYIYYSIPADCQVDVNQYGQPYFFTKYDESKASYDFTLTKLSGGKEKKFALFCLADPQCKNETHRNRLMNESVPDIKAHAAYKGIPCYGVTLGDVAYSEGSINCESQMPHLRDHMAKDVIGMPIFQTMGNHDYTYFHTNMPINPDQTSSTFNIKAQRAFEEVFGPINYSWNRGDTHIVCMRNMQWNSNTASSNYSMMFTDEQYEWLRQDLSFVPKDKMVILCVHIPLTNSKNKNVQNVIALLKQYKEAHIMSGHTHYMRNEPTLSGGVYEHVHAAVCGTWWYSKVNGDGSPNGYGVYDISGNTIENWYYKGVNEGMNDRDYQIRLYRGDLKCGGKHEYIQLQHGDGVILANVFNADSKWVVKVYENDQYSGNMTRISHKKTSPTAGSGQDDPTKPTTDSSQDWWAIGYHIGVVGRGHVGGSRSNYLTNCYHMYKYTLKDKNAKVRVEAIDRFGTSYSTSTFTDDYDYSLLD